MLRTDRALQTYWKASSALIITGALFAVVSISAASASAQSVVCVANVTSDLTLNGVVAQGVGAGCPVGPVWPNVNPVEFLPGGGSPNAYMFLAYRPATKHLFIGIDLKGDPDLSTQDIVSIVFDANNNNSFDAGDFVIKVNVWNGTPIETGNTGGLPGAACNQTPGSVEVTRFVTGTGWETVADTAVGQSVHTKLSYDYETSIDAEDKIWNLEIDLPVGPTINGTKYFDLQTGGSFFGIGAYIFMDTGHHDGVQNPQTGIVLKWPTEMIDRQITQQNLFGIPASTADQLGDTNLADTCFDVNLPAASPWEINGSTAASGDHRIKRNGDNEFRVTFFFDGPGSTVTPLTNNGTVRLDLLPYTAGGHGNVITLEQQVDAAQFNHVKTVTFHHDFAGAVNFNFICATMSLVGFQRNDNKSNDSLNVNFNYFTTSDYSTEFMVFGDAIPSLKPGETGTVFLRMESANDPEAAKTGTSSGVLSQPNTRAFGSNLAIVLTMTIFVSSLLILSISLKSRYRPKVKAFASALALGTLLVLSFQVACRRPAKPPKPGIGTTRWQITNSDALGLKPVEGQRDLYQMPISYGEGKLVQLTFLGRPLSYKTETQTFNPAGPDGNPNVLRIPVKPGEAVTVVASGEIDLDGPNGPIAPTSATGTVLPAVVPNLLAVGRPNYLLSGGYYSPNEYAGSLIGSFDNFETSFVVGRSSSIVVPANAGTLALSVNAERGSYARIVGNYQISTIVTPGPSIPTHTSIQGDATFHVPLNLRLWEVLTSLNVYTYYETTDVGGNGRIRSRTLNQAGAAHFSIYDSHVGR